MGVLACDREGCTNILCDRLSNVYGYICNECFEELVNSGSAAIMKFMATEQKEHELDRGFYEKIFPSR